jgi:hypothetical protein
MKKLLKVWEWKVWERKFWAGLGKTEYFIGFIAFCAWLAIEVGGKLFGWETYPVGYWQKIAFGILATSIISAVGWVWLGASFPELKKLIDPDSMNIQQITTWEKLKLALFFWGFYVGSAVLLSSLY